MSHGLVQSSATKVFRHLRFHGFVIDRYNSRSSSSVYFTLDRGLAGSIRISDHPNASLFNHRYNVSTQCREFHSHRFSHGERIFFYPVHQIDKMIEDIVANREARMHAIGKNIYEVLLDRKYHVLRKCYPKHKQLNRLAK